MIAIPFSPETQFSARTAQILCKITALLGALLVWMIVAQAQAAPDEHPGDPQARVIDGVVNTTVFGLGQSIRITGTVKEGAIAFGGDVIVEGSVDGDVAAIAGVGDGRDGPAVVWEEGGVAAHFLDVKGASGDDRQNVRSICHVN